MVRLLRNEQLLSATVGQINLKPSEQAPVREN